MVTGGGGGFVLPCERKAKVQTVEFPSPGGRPDGLEVPTLAAGELCRRSQLCALEALYEVLPFAFEPVPVSDCMELQRTPKSTAARDSVDITGRCAGRWLSEAVWRVDPIGGQKSVVVALGRDFRPWRFRVSAERGERAGAPVSPTKLGARLGGKGIERGEAVHPPALGKREKGEDAEQAGAAVRTGNALDPLHRFRDPVVLRETESNAPGRESIQLGRRGRGATGDRLPGTGRSVRIPPSDRRDGEGDRLPPCRLAFDSIRPGHDTGGTAVVADPAFGDGAVRLIEHPGNIPGEAPVAAPERNFNPMPEMFRSSSPPFRPEGECGIACLVLGPGYAPEFR